jgi:hypothetical protein
MRYLLLIPAIIFLSGCAHTDTKEIVVPEPATAPDTSSSSQSNGLSLVIIPSNYASDIWSEDPVRIDDTADLYLEIPQSAFYVMLSNNSEQAVRIFQDWNSWGYFGLSFEMESADGEKTTMTKQKSAWSKNFPSYFDIAKGGHHIFPVNFSDENWKISYRGEPMRCRLKAIYSVEKSEEAEKYHVWTGEVCSSSNYYRIWHP